MNRLPKEADNKFLRRGLYGRRSIFSAHRISVDMESIRNCRYSFSKEMGFNAVVKNRVPYNEIYTLTIFTRDLQDSSDTASPAHKRI